MNPVTAIHAPARADVQPVDQLVLAHDERRVRRKVLRAKNGTELLLDLPQTTTLEPGQLLEVAPKQYVEVVAAEELLYEIRAKDTAHLVRLAWHIGNRHTSAQLEEGRILIQRDHVLKTMLEGLGAIVNNVTEPFFAEHGAYHSHAHADGGHALLARR
jgi:urease accessory protein